MVCRWFEGLSLPSGNISTKKMLSEKGWCGGVNIFSHSGLQSSLQYPSVFSSSSLSSGQQYSCAVWEMIDAQEQGTRNCSRRVRSNHQHVSSLQVSPPLPQGFVCVFILSILPKINILIWGHPDKFCRNDGSSSLPCYPMCSNYQWDCTKSTRTSEGCSRNIFNSYQRQWFMCSDLLLWI